MLRQRAFTLAAVIALVTGCGDDATGPRPSSALPSDVSPAVSPTVADFDDYSWRMFVALNWPTVDGRPSDQPIGALPHHLRVWETWIDPSMIIPPRAGLSVRIPENPDGRSLNTDFFLQAGSSLPLIDATQNFIVNEFVIDPTLARFTLENGLVSTAGFQQYAQTHTSVDLPSGSISVKASWRVFPPSTDPATLARYHVRNATISVAAAQSASGEAFRVEGAKIGLIGLHITQKTPTRAQWIWSTFEHEDLYEGPNPVLPVGGEGALESNRQPQLATTGAPPTEFLWNDPTTGQPSASAYLPSLVARSPNERALPEETNRTWRGMLPEPWSHYRLVVTQWADAQGAPHPTNPTGISIARNLALETYLLGDPLVALQVPGHDVLDDCPQAGDGSTLWALVEQDELYLGYPATGRTPDVWSSCLLCHQLALYRYGEGPNDVIGTDYSFIYRSYLPNLACPGGS